MSDTFNIMSIPISEERFDLEASDNAKANLAQMRAIHAPRQIKITALEIDEYINYTLRFWWGEVEATETNTSMIFMILD